MTNIFRRQAFFFLMMIILVYSASGMILTRKINSQAAQQGEAMDKISLDPGSQIQHKEDYFKYTYSKSQNIDFLRKNQGSKNYQINGMKKDTQLQKEEQTERILSNSSLSFSQISQISDENFKIFDIKWVQNYLLFRGSWQSKSKILNFDSEKFSAYFTGPEKTFGRNLQFDPIRKWFFQGKNNGTINFFVQKNNVYSFYQQLKGEKTNEMLYQMDLHEDYLLVSFYYENLLFKWDGAMFNLVQNFNINYQCYGLKMCIDGTIIAVEYYDADLEGKKSVFKAYRNSSTIFTVDQSWIIGPLNKKYGFVATDDCSTVILSPTADEKTGQIFVMIRDFHGQFMNHSRHLSPRTNSFYSKSCIHPNGEFYVDGRTGGGDVWIKNSEGIGYSYHSLLEESYDIISCDINDELFVFSDRNGVVYYSRFSIEDPQPSNYGKKINLVIDQAIKLDEEGRKIIDLAASGENLVAIQQYSGSRTYKKNSLSYEIKQTLSQSIFFSSLDAEESLKLLVIGSYNGEAYVYQDKGEGFSYLQRNPTSSQILAVDLDSEGRLLLGHMNGDLSKYEWDSSTFISQGNFSSTGTRILGVKSCPSQEMVILKEKYGQFYFQLLTADGGEKFEHQLEELFDVQMAVSSDCGKVFISSSMQMNVKVFTRQNDTYSLFKTVQELFPLYDIAVNPDADIFVVNRHTDNSSAVYRYDQCTQDYNIEETLQGNEDDYAVEVTESEIILGDQGGNVKVHSYSYSTKVCDPFGKKNLSAITDLTTLNSSARRAITDMDISGDLVIVSSYYSPMLFFQIPELGPISVTPFNQSIFVSSVSIVSSLSTFVAGTFEKTALVYIDSGSGFTLNQTIQTQSQVTSVHLTTDNHLLAGMINGDLIEFASDGQTFSPTGANISNQNSRVYGAKLCPGGVRVALLENSGVFKLSIFASDGTETPFISELSEELIEVYLAASSDCSILAVSGVTMQKVHVLKEDKGYFLFDTISSESPLSKVSMEENGDLLVVASITSQESYVYQYLASSKHYFLKQTISSGGYDEAIVITSQFILEGNQQGLIKVSQYSWTYNPDQFITYHCGNGKYEPWLDEQCDDGNFINTDGCQAQCRQNPYFTCSNVPGQRSVCSQDNDVICTSVPRLMLSSKQRQALADSEFSSVQSMIDLVVSHLVEKDLSGDIVVNESKYQNARTLYYAQGLYSQWFIVDSYVEGCVGQS